MKSDFVPPSDGPTSNQDELADLVTRCILGFEERGTSAIDEILLTAPDLAAVAREQLHALRTAGLLVPPSPDPESIGPYRILRRLGTGGVGSVFLAEQSEPVRRQVAIKVIRPGMDSREVLARFAVERQTLALLDHPNVARVLDAGTTPGGRPYLCMDYVPGQPITRYCDERRLDLHQRIELMARVCDAVQAAHQRGILHRDLKPSNILVSDRDGKAWPTVIDFGVAKSLGPRLLDITLLTGHGRLVGTLEYMSPEQAANEIDVDTRTDVHALGVVLYELLSGCLPFASERLRRADPSELLRILRDEQAPRPSVACRGGANAKERAERRCTTVPALARSIERELDWITQKATEKDRNRRYGMAADVATDLRNYLANEPVSAGPPTTWYRWRKLIARHRLQAASLAAIMIALLAGLITSLAFYSDAMAKTIESEASLDVALEAVERMVQAGEDRLHVVPRMEEVRRELLTEALALHRRLALTSGERRVRLRTARALSGLANIQAQLGDYEHGLESAKQAQTMLQQLPPEQRDTPGVMQLNVDLTYSLALWARELDLPLTTSNQYLEQAHRDVEHLVAVADPNPELRLLAAKILGTKAESMLEGDAERARAMFERSEKLLEPLLIETPEHSSRFHVARAAQVLFAMARHAGFLVRIGDRDGAMAMGERLHGLATAAFDKEDDLIHRARLIPAIVEIAMIWYRSEQFPRVVSELEPVIQARRKLIRDFPAVPAHREGLGIALLNTALAEERMGQLASAGDRLREARTLFENLVREHPDSPRLRERLLQTLLNVAHQASVLARYGSEVDWTEADAAIEKGMAVIAGASQSDTWSSRAEELAADFARIRGLVYSLRGQHAKALPARREAVTRYEALSASQPDSAWLASRLVDVYENLARTLVATNDIAAAAPLLSKALALQEQLAPKLMGADHAARKQRELLELQMQVDIERGEFAAADTAMDRYLALAKNPANDRIGCTNVAGLALLAAQKATETDTWRQRFAERVRNLVAATVSDAPLEHQNAMVAVMSSNMLRRLVELEQELGNTEAAAAAQTRVVAGYAAALAARDSERNRERVADALRALIDLRQAAADTEGVAAAKQELAALQKH